MTKYPRRWLVLDNGNAVNMSRILWIEVFKRSDAGFGVQGVRQDSTQTLVEKFDRYERAQLYVKLVTEYLDGESGPDAGFEEFVKNAPDAVFSRDGARYASLQEEPSQ